jgi:SAM-dependent methyltransferase
MERSRISAITHGDLEYANPLAPGWFDHLAAWAGLRPGDRVFDAGCGAGELLIALAERFGTGGLGVDPSPEAVAEARRRARERVPDADIAFEQADVGSLEAFPESFALAACVAATHAYGGLRATLRALAGLVPIGGHVLVGEGFWTREPAPAYLRAFGATTDELEDLDSTLLAGVECGLELVESVVAGGQEWDAYESALLANGERWLAEHADAPESDAQDVRAWLGASRARLDAPGGRDTLGFVAILHRRVR